MGHAIDNQAAHITKLSSSPAGKKTTVVTIAVLLMGVVFSAIDMWPRHALTHQVERFHQWTRAALTRSAAVVEMATSRQDPLYLADIYARGCPPHHPHSRLISMDPLMIYVEQLVTPEEAAHLLHAAGNNYKPSAIVEVDGKKHDSEFRKSVSAGIPHDPVMACIRKRVAEFQAFTPVENVEEIYVVKYGVNDHIQHHHDWHEALMNPRVTTFFVYVACNDGRGGPCEGGETNFPDWTAPVAPEWCDRGYINCEAQAPGLSFRPIVGNAVFWNNYHANGTGIETTWHAGLPVTKGTKAGLNVWTRKHKASKSDILQVYDRSQLSDKDRALCDADSKTGPCYIRV